MKYRTAVITFSTTLVQCCLKCHDYSVMIHIAAACHINVFQLDILVFLRVILVRLDSIFRQLLERVFFAYDQPSSRTAVSFSGWDICFSSFRFLLEHLPVHWNILIYQCNPSILSLKFQGTSVSNSLLIWFWYFHFMWFNSFLFRVSTYYSKFWV